MFDMDSTKILLGRKIRLLRKAKGWTQEEFDRISQAERDQAIECAGL